VSSFGTETTSTCNRGIGAADDTFAIPGVGAEIHDSHEMGFFSGAEGVALNLKFGHFCGQRGSVLLGELGKRFEGKHLYQNTKSCCRCESGDGREGVGESRVWV